MAVLAFVLVFLLLAFGAFFLAMSGGPKAARRKTQGRKGLGGVTALFVVVLVLLGVAIPVYAITTDKDRKSIPEANVTELTPLQEKGRELFGERCRNCHTLKAANAVAQVGPNLDNLRPPKNLVLDAIHQGRARGNGNMAADLVEGKDADDVASFVAKAVGQTGQKQASP
jgi:mono/diheme cytochrome c family protein